MSNGAMAQLLHWVPLRKNRSMAHPPLLPPNGAAKGAGAANDKHGFSEGQPNAQ
jgi:hypothetical protein